MRFPRATRHRQLRVHHRTLRLALHREKGRSRRSALLRALSASPDVGETLSAGMRFSRCVRTRVRTSAETPIARGSVAGVTGYASSAGTDRVVERRQAVALARHFREFEGLSIREIADRLGRSPATVKAYF